MANEEDDRIEFRDPVTKAVVVEMMRVSVKANDLNAGIRASAFVLAALCRVVAKQENVPSDELIIQVITEAYEATADENVLVLSDHRPSG